MHLIGICGAAGAGKDSLAKGITNHFSYYISYSLASPMKKMLATLLGDVDWDNRQWKEANVQGLGVSPRFLAQTLGTEWGRQAVQDNFWLLMAERYMASLPEYVAGIVIPDIRFENEAEWLKSHNGILIEVRRPANPYVIDNVSHVSEGGIPGPYVDYTVENKEGRLVRAIAECRDIVHFSLAPKGAA